MELLPAIGLPSLMQTTTGSTKVLANDLIKTDMGVLKRLAKQDLMGLVDGRKSNADTVQ